MEKGLAEYLAGSEMPDIRSYSPGALAYIGDGVYELIVRTMLLSGGNRSADALQRAGSHYAKAESQARVVEFILNNDILSEEEFALYKRGRNTDTHTHSRNASHADYQKATGLECLVGFLYLSGQDKRLMELIDLVIAAIDRTEQKD